MPLVQRAAVTAFARDVNEARAVRARSVDLMVNDRARCIANGKARPPQSL